MNGKYRSSIVHNIEYLLIIKITSNYLTNFYITEKTYINYSSLQYCKVELAGDWWLMLSDASGWNRREDDRGGDWSAAYTGRSFARRSWWKRWNRRERRWVIFKNVSLLLLILLSSLFLPINNSNQTFPLKKKRMERTRWVASQRRYSFATSRNRDKNYN